MSASLQIHWLVLVVLPILANAQQEAPYFTRYTMEQGLADNWVHSAMRDSKGFLWLGTEGGLSRFDGQRFLNFYAQKDKPSSLSNNTVRDIIEDPDGSFWLAVLDGGLNHFDPATGKFEAWKTDDEHPAAKKMLLSITSILPDGDLLWLGSYKLGVGCFDKKKRRFVGWYPFQTDSLNDNSFQFNTANHLVADRGNPRYIWVAASGRGLARFDKVARSFELIDLKDSKGVGGVSAMWVLQDADGLVWTATWSAGLASYDPIAKQLKSYPYDAPSWEKADPKRNVILSVLEKNKDELWVATEDNGFGIFYKKTGRYHFFDNPLSGESPELDRSCQQLFLDNGGRLWVLGVRGGVRSFDFENQSFRYISLATGNGKTERAEATAFAHDPKRGLVFVATENSGCYEWSAAKNQLVQRAKPLPGGLFPNFRAVHCSANGNIWAASMKTLGGSASLYILRPGQAFFEPVTMPLPIPKQLEETVNDILEDSNGNIWVATSYDGLYRISPDLKTATRFAHKSGFPENAPSFEIWWAILDMEEGQQGHLWLALKGGGLLDFDPATARFVKYDDHNSPISNYSQSLKMGMDDKLWIGAKNKGIQVVLPADLPKASALTFSQQADLAVDIVSRIEKDESGNIWAATDHGLAVYDPTGQKIKVFGMAEGLKNHFLVNKGLAIFSDLGVLVGQPNGFCLLRQTNAKTKKSAPIKVVLTDFKVLNQSSYFEKNIRNASEIELEPSENVFEFEFSTPAAPNADLVKYQFMLDGFDEKWYTTEGRKSITYTELLPGNYVFKVRAIQVGNDRSPATTLAICILPHWWQTWWFIAAMLSLLALAVWAIIRYRTAQVRHEEQLKTAFYKELSEKEMTALRSQMNPHFIFNCLNSINNFIVRNNSEQAASYVTKFSRLIRLVLDNSQQQKIPLEKELEALRLYMDLEAMRFDGKFRYEVWVDDAVDEQYLQIPPLLVQPYVENAIWHGLMHKPEGGSVVVDVRLPAEDLLYIEITDDGVGRVRAAELESKTALEHKSQGTLITAERLHNLNPDKPDQGKVSIHDLVDEQGQPCGTRVVLEIPV